MAQVSRGCQLPLPLLTKSLLNYRAGTGAHVVGHMRVHKDMSFFFRPLGPDFG